MGTSFFNNEAIGSFKVIGLDLTHGCLKIFENFIITLGVGYYEGPIRTSNAGFEKVLKILSRPKFRAKRKETELLSNQKGVIKRNTWLPGGTLGI